MLLIYLSLGTEKRGYVKHQRAECLKQDEISSVNQEIWCLSSVDMQSINDTRLLNLVIPLAKFQTSVTVPHIIPFSLLNITLVFYACQLNLYCSLQSYAWKTLCHLFTQGYLNLTAKIHWRIDFVFVRYAEKFSNCFKNIQCGNNFLRE